MVNRRHALRMLSAAGTLPLIGATNTAACIVTPAETEGPFFVDERLRRSDLTTGTSRDAVIHGTPLVLQLTVSRVTDGSCVPLAGALVDVWHADALGVYSDEQALSSAGERFLRGYQVTDRTGTVRFTTIYPGWYQGRTAHVHFKIRTSPASSRAEFTSQLYFEDATTDAVFRGRPYATRGRRDTTNASDSLFDRRLVLSLRKSAAGYTGTFAVGLRVS
jgi:protocatechuate 3,4-dioxygenase beta subunit